MVLVTNGRLITRDSEGKGYYEHGAVAYEGAKIVEVGEEAALRAKYADAEIIDAKGGVIMPAFINAHTHIYSALARGLSIVGNNPTNFYEVLDGTWWAIDRHLMMDGTRASATALYMDSIKQGVTTIFDHHASYGEIPGTLFTISEESRRLGLRSCLCYEVSDRDGEEKCLQAIKENADFITYCQKQNDPMLAAMFGGHALFTISDKTFDRMVEANNGRTGYHIHVSEGMNDVYDSLQNYGRRPVQRLQDHGILGEKTILGHCIHVNTAEMDIIKETGTMVVNNPESNMGNAIGICPVLQLYKRGILLGMGADPGVKVTFKDCVSKNNTIHAAYDMGGLAGMIQRGNGVDNASVENCTVEHITVDYYEECVDVQGKATLKENDKNGADVIKEVSGKYWVNGGYYWGGYADYYVSYGDSSYDAPVEGYSMRLANSEYCVNK